MQLQSQCVCGFRISLHLPLEPELSLIFFFFNKLNLRLAGISLAIQQLIRHASNAGGRGLILGRGTRIPHAVRHSQNNNNNKIKYLEKKKKGLARCCKKQNRGTALVVQWLRLCFPTQGVAGSNLGQGAKVPHDSKSNKSKA